MERENPNIDVDAAFEALDPNAQRVIMDAAQRWAREKQSARPETIAPADGGRAGDEQYPAPVDAIKLLDTTTTSAATIYDVEVSIAGTLDHIGVIIGDDGSVEVRSAE